MPRRNRDRPGLFQLETQAHEYLGSDELCVSCGLPKEAHIPGSPKKRRRSTKKHTEKPGRWNDPIVFLDTEGMNLSDEIGHCCTYISAVDETGHKLGQLSRYTAQGLTSIEILEWLFSLERTTFHGFSLGYDHAMMLRDLPDRTLYRLVHPETRLYKNKKTGRSMHGGVDWLGFRFWWLAGRLQIQRVRRTGRTPGDWRTEVYGPKITIWDVFRFFGCRFTVALEDWKIESPMHDMIVRMKGERRSFSPEQKDEIEPYCDAENAAGALLTRRLIQAHEGVDLELRDFFGAGSTASAMLRKLGVKDHLALPPDGMVRAVSAAFFGGRFETSVVGEVEGPLWSADICSAYPYQTAFLPCLAHGAWRLVTKDVDKEIRNAVARKSLALVHCRVRASGPVAWGPLPFRLDDGSIRFPLGADSVWTWQDEYLAAKDTLWPGVTALEAWVFDRGCDEEPFAEVPAYYLERLRIGKEGKGKVIKLGCNSLYGKLAQSVGAAPFRSMVLAGVITSGTRALLLRAMASAKDLWNVLMTATDGILSREPLTLPLPRDTGTGQAPELYGKPALGDWEVKKIDRGAMIVRPGIYFPLDPTEADLKEARSRGLSKHALVKHAANIVEHYRRTKGKPHEPNADCGDACWDQGDAKGKQKLHSGAYCVPNERFVGLRQGIRMVGKKKPRIVRADGHDANGKRVGFCQWQAWPIEVSFHAEPKRREVTADGRLLTWRHERGESRAYDPSLQPEDTRKLREFQQVVDDQPDAGDV